MDAEALARYQQVFAKIGEAYNQCPGCGVFRLDGAPPILHREDCEDRSDIGELIERDFRARELTRLRKLYGFDLT